MADPALLFALPLSVQAYEEKEHLLQLLNTVDLVPDVVDTRIFAWGSTSYSSARYYKFLFANAPTDRGLDLIWESKCLPKLRIFVWLLMHDRLNTKDLMIRKHWHVEGGPMCVLCTNQILETRDHLFFDCPFATVCWDAVGILWDTQSLISPRMLAAKMAFGGPCFMEIFAAAAWNIWKARNDHIFKNHIHSFGSWRVKFLNDVLLHQHRVKPALVSPLIEWVRLSFT